MWSERCSRNTTSSPLIQDRPSDGLRKGDVGAVVHCYRDTEVYEVEFIDEHGRTKGVVTIPADALMRLNLLSLTA